MLDADHPAGGASRWQLNFIEQYLLVGQLAGPQPDVVPAGGEFPFIGFESLPKLIENNYPAWLGAVHFKG